MITLSVVPDAEASRAGWTPMRTCGATGSMAKPSPSSVTRPPSIPQSGRTEVRRPTDILASAFLVELDVPIEIVAPRFRGVAQPDGDANRGGFFGRFRDGERWIAGCLGGRPA